MLFRAVFLGGQVAALIGILFALPPIIIYKVTKGQGLKLSFCLFLFYFIQGLYYLIHGTRHERVKRATKLFHLMELPFLTVFTLFSFIWIPNFMLAPYEWFLWIMHPLLILLEGGAFLFLILSFGQYLATSIAYFERKDKYRESPYDSDSEEDEDLPRGKRILKKLFCCFSCSRSVTLLLKAFTLIGSFGMIGISCGWLFMMTRQFNFTLYSSSLISSALTFFVLLVTSSFLMAQSSSIISDPACILLYLVYNIWIILRDEKSASSSLLPSSLVWPTDPWNFQFSAFPLGYELITTNLVDFVHSYTVEIILNLLFRITIYLLSSKMVAKFHEQILEKESSKFGPIILSDRSPPFNEHLLSGEEELTITDLLYAFGKCAMILLYTFSWLESHETSSFYTYHLFSNTSMALVPWRPAYWRWINIYWVLLLYFWHLYTQN